MKSTYDIIIWVFIFILIALIFGLYLTEKMRIPKSLYSSLNYGSLTPYMEHFENEKKNIDNYKNSSLFDIKNGASSKYGWGINENDYIRYKKDLNENDLDENDLDEDVRGAGEEIKKCVKKNSNINLAEEEKKKLCVKEYIEKNGKSCNKCDILKHPEIDNYVLKSSVPPCPKIDLNNYIKKSEMPICPPKIDLNQYVKKSEIPKCPTCPTIPDNLKGKSEVKNTYQFNILDIKNLSNSDIELLLKDERIKSYLDEKYEDINKKNIPKPNIEKSLSTSTSSIFDEEYNKNKVYGKSSTLWDEIKGLFTSNKNNEEEEEYLIKHVINDNKNITNNAEEEENVMIYNKNECQSMLKPLESNAMGLYAGDSLYASV